MKPLTSPQASQPIKRLNGRVFGYWGTLLLFCLSAAWLYKTVTPNGVGLTNDSAAYLGGARSILAGEGYLRFSGDRLPRPITQFPPLYAYMIAGIARLSDEDVFQSAWILNLFCYLLNLLLFAGLARQFSKKNLAGLLAALVYLCCGPILQAHVYGLSEAFFLIFFLSSLRIMYGFPRSKHNFFDRLLFGIWIGLSILTRYAGIVILITAVLFLINEPESPRRRVGGLICMLSGTFLTVLPWLRLNTGDTQSAVNRSFFFHLPGADVVRDGIVNLTEFFLPERSELIQKTLPFWQVFWAVVFLLAVGWLLVAFFRQFQRKENSAAPALYLLTLQTAAYAAMLMLVALFVDGSTVFDNRMLLPFYVGACALIVTAAACFMEKKGARCILAIAVILVFCLFLAEDKQDLVKSYRQDGQGFAGSVWRESQTAEAVDKLPQEKTYFSNRQTFLWLMKDRPAYILPALQDAATRQKNASFTEEKNWMRSEILSGNAFAVVFNYAEIIQDTQDKQWLDELFDALPVYGEYADGIIYGVKP